MTRHIIIPDCQIKPTEDRTYLSWVGKYIAESKPDTIINLGDFADMPSLSSYDVGKKSFEGRKYTDDIKAAHEAMLYLTWPIHQERSRLQQNKKKQWYPRMVLTLGNHEHRINKAIENDRKLEGLISVDDLEYDRYGWEVYPFLQPVVIDGVCYVHYQVSGVMDRAINTARLILNKKHMSCVVGHKQGRDVAYDYKADGSRMTAIIAGSCYLHDEHYLNYQSNNHWRGIIVLNEVDNGQFDEMFVSLNYLRKRYASNS